MSPRWELSPLERLTQKFEVVGECWIWRAHSIANGYGQFYLDGRHVLAHRASYIIHVGPIPTGLTIDHLCRNRGCVNPAHLEPVTHKENVRRAARLVTHCPRGHEYTERNTRLYRGMRGCRACHADRERARRALKRLERHTYSHVLSDETELDYEGMLR